MGDTNLMTNRIGRIHDRETFLERAESEVRRAQRYERTVTVLLLEVDERNAITAKHGEAWVEILIDIVALVCRENLRDPDVLGRYEDGVLAFVLPEANESAGVRLADRLTKGLSELRLPTARGPLTFTISAGVAASVGEVAELSEILGAAEAQLVAAHKAGGRQVRGCFVGERREHLDEALARLGRRGSDNGYDEIRSVELTSDELNLLLSSRCE